MEGKLSILTRLIASIAHMNLQIVQCFLKIGSEKIQAIVFLSQLLSTDLWCLGIEWN